MPPALTIATPTHRIEWAGEPSKLISIFTGELYVEDLMLLPHLTDDELVCATVFPDDIWEAARPLLLALWPSLLTHRSDRTFVVEPASFDPQVTQDGLRDEP